MESEVEKIWRLNVENVISRWERETETLKDKTLNPDECHKISDMFHKDTNWLLVRKPAETIDDDIITRLDQLDNKLNSTLAMACGFSDSEEETI